MDLRTFDLTLFALELEGELFHDWSKLTSSDVLESVDCVATCVFLSDFYIDVPVTMVDLCSVA